MNKVYGNLKEFAPIRSDRSRLIVAYNCQPLEDNIHATWCEIYFYKKPHPVVTLDDIKSAILEDIDNEVKRMIIETMTWDNKQVWLSIENQQNYKTALDVAKETDGDNLPVKFKLGDEDKPTYVTFETINSLKEFWLACCAHVRECLNYGWQLKDSIDWSKYQRESKDDI